MIDHTMPGHRNRLASSIAYWHNQMAIYGRERTETIMRLSGSRAFANSLGAPANRGDKSRVLGNLLQLDAQALQVLLAYGEPIYKIVANLAHADAVAPFLQEWINRYSSLLNLGDLARGIALDSYAGWGIAWVDNGLLPAGVRNYAGQIVGPCCYRVSQNDFGFDGDASQWQDVSYVYRVSYPSLNEARRYYAAVGNPEVAASLQEFSLVSPGNTSRVQPHANKQAMADPKTRLIHVYLPGNDHIVTWPAHSIDFAQVNNEALHEEPYAGHHTGPAAVLSHLDIPDNLIPFAKCESTKRLDMLFNELGSLVTEQARNARYNPIYETGGQRDVQNILNAKDRTPVGVNNIAKIGSFSIPGPDQGQSNVWNATYALFKELSGNLDDVLGLAPTAGTATQSNLIRQATGARGAESQRRMNRLMELIGRKLCHLVLRDPTHVLPMRRTVPGTDISVDSSWGPWIPRNPNADDYCINIVPGSMSYRSSEQRLAALNGCMDRIFKAMSYAAQGFPVNIPYYIEVEADYNNLPELRKMCDQMLPNYQMEKASAQVSNSDKPNGQYQRTNVSERSNGGALTQAMTQFSSGEGGASTAAA